MVLIKGPSKSDQHPEAKRTLMRISFNDESHADMPDGEICALDLNPPDGNPDGWELRLPAALEVTCPHGQTIKFHELLHAKAS